MKTIFSCRFGSHLYGTDTPTSDIDIKSIHLPSAYDILMQKDKGSISTKRSKGDGEKNYAGEIDKESYSLRNYLKLISEGQTVSLDMLFADKRSITQTSWEWECIQSHREYLISKKSEAFIGYCMQQAKKYGIKGSRVDAVRKTLDFLKSLDDGHYYKLGDFTTAIDVFTFKQNNEFITIVDQVRFLGGIVRFLEVCGRKLSYTATLKNAIEVLQRLFDEYGTRALMAETNQGVDWKALSHAVRIAEQAIELFQTGHIIFPRPNAMKLLAIKKGEVNYAQVAEEIEDLFVQVKEASEKSTLPTKVDQKWIDEFVYGVYRDVVIKEGK